VVFCLQVFKLQFYTHISSPPYGLRVPCLPFLFRNNSFQRIFDGSSNPFAIYFVTFTAARFVIIETGTILYVYVCAFYIYTQKRPISKYINNTGPKGRGFDSGQDDGFLRAIKICSTPSFRWEVKLDVQCRKILRHAKELLKSHGDG
jgi:hypothetical protein